MLLDHTIISYGYYCRVRNSTHTYIVLKTSIGKHPGNISTVVKVQQELNLKNHERTHFFEGYK